MGLCNMTHAHDTCILFLMHAKVIQLGQSKEFCSFPTMIFKILVHPHQSNLSSERQPILGDLFVGFPVPERRGSSHCLPMRGYH